MSRKVFYNEEQNTLLNKIVRIKMFNPEITITESFSN